MSAKCRRGASYLICGRRLSRYAQEEGQNRVHCNDWPQKDASQTARDSEIERDGCAVDQHSNSRWARPKELPSPTRAIRLNSAEQPLLALRTPSRLYRG